MASIFVNAVLAYLAVGLVLAVYFAAAGLSRMAEEEGGFSGGTPGFRVVSILGATVLWPWLALRLLRPIDAPIRGARSRGGLGRSVRLQKQMHLLLWLVLAPVLALLVLVLVMTSPLEVEAPPEAAMGVEGGAEELEP